MTNEELINTLIDAATKVGKGIARVKVPEEPGPQLLQLRVEVLARMKDDETCETVALQPTTPAEIEGGRLADPKALSHYPNALPGPIDAPTCPNCGHVGVREGASYKCLNCGASLRVS
ncbi:MAG TPA: hypothetical protein VJH94_04240 [Candidatus Paceibacterota bacterium]